MADIRHFYKAERLTRLETMPNAEFVSRFPGVKGTRSDCYKMRVGYTADHRGPFPVQRSVEFKAFASMHECNSRCIGGKMNGTCECSCGGANHGLGSVLKAEGVS